MYAARVGKKGPLTVVVDEVTCRRCVQLLIREYLDAISDLVALDAGHAVAAQGLEGTHREAAHLLRARRRELGGDEQCRPVRVQVP